MTNVLLNFQLNFTLFFVYMCCDWQVQLLCTVTISFLGHCVSVCSGLDMAWICRYLFEWVSVTCTLYRVLLLTSFQTFLCPWAKWYSSCRLWSSFGPHRTVLFRSNAKKISWTLMNVVKISNNSGQRNQIPTHSEEKHKVTAVWLLPYAQLKVSQNLWNILQ